MPATFLRQFSASAHVIRNDIFFAFRAKNDIQLDPVLAVLSPDPEARKPQNDKNIEGEILGVRGLQC